MHPEKFRLYQIQVIFKLYQIQDGRLSAIIYFHMADIW